MDTVDYGDYVDYWYFGPCGLCGLWMHRIMWFMVTLDHVDYIYRVDYVYSGFLSDKVKSIHNDNVIWMSDMVMDIKWIHGWMAKLCMFLYFHPLLSFTCDIHLWNEERPEALTLHARCSRRTHQGTIQKSTGIVCRAH